LRITSGQEMPGLVAPNIAEYVGENVISDSFESSAWRRVSWSQNS
jgi:hypothetical protein